MSIFSDYKAGAMNEEEYRMSCAQLNNQDRYEREHEFDEEQEEENEED